MSLTNTSKPTTSLTNAAKVSIGETWGSIQSTWASETRTWLEVSQLITNTTFDRSGTFIWSVLSFPWLMDFPWLTDGSGGITNTSKP